MFAPEIHKAAHRRSYLPWLEPLQNLGILLGSRGHARHHRDEHDASYCVVTGWWNPVLDWAGAWSRLDALVALFTYSSLGRWSKAGR
jgi:hypothetical protein